MKRIKFVRIPEVWGDVHEFCTNSKGRIIPYMDIYGNVKYCAPGYYWCQYCKQFTTFDENGWLTCWCR